MVEQLAKDESFLEKFDKFDSNPELQKARQIIANPIHNTRWEEGLRVETNSLAAEARKTLLEHPDRGAMVPALTKRLYDRDQDYPCLLYTSDAADE